MVSNFKVGAEICGWMPFVSACEELDEQTIYEVAYYRFNNSFTKQIILVA
jgi:hypothetical protein